MGPILDSNILIAAERHGHTVRQILEQMRALHGNVAVGISVVSVAEITHGAYRTKDESLQQRRLAFVDRLCSDMPVCPITLDVARLIGRIEGQQAALGYTLAFEDLAIGVTALHLGYEVVTHNEKHFKLIPGLIVHG